MNERLYTHARTQTQFLSPILFLSLFLSCSSLIFSISSLLSFYPRLSLFSLPPLSIYLSLLFPPRSLTLLRNLALGLSPFFYTSLSFSAFPFFHPFPFLHQHKDVDRAPSIRDATCTTSKHDDVPASFPLWTRAFPVSLGTHTGSAQCVKGDFFSNSSRRLHDKYLSKSITCAPFKGFFPVHLNWSMFRGFIGENIFSWFPSRRQVQKHRPVLLNAKVRTREESYKLIRKKCSIQGFLHQKHNITDCNLSSKKKKKRQKHKKTVAQKERKRERKFSRICVCVRF